MNLFIGMAALPVAFRLLPSRHDAEEHRLDFAGNLLLAAVLLLILVPLVEGRVSGWPGWSWLLLGLAFPAAAAGVAWELRLEHRGGEPVIQVGLLRDRRAFRMGQALALLYFAGFTSLFFTLSILWQEGLGHSALQAGLLVLPFAAGSMLTASSSYRFSRRFGRTAVLLAGLGNGLVIAPNQDFVLASVPREQAGTAGGALITAQRLGAAIGIAVIAQPCSGRVPGAEAAPGARPGR